MLGAIAGDIIGSAYERHNTSRYDFGLFTPQSSCTDDSVLTVAVAHALLEGMEMEASIRLWAGRYPHAGYGPGFLAWLGGRGARSSKGNGAAMRVSPIAWFAQTLEECLALAERQARLTHDTPEGIAGALAVAAAVYTARTGGTLAGIAEIVRSVAPEYDVSWPRSLRKPGALARESVPAAIASFLVSTSWEDAVRRAVSLGGDSDTIASIAGAIAEAYYGEIPELIALETVARLPDDLLKVYRKFEVFCRKHSSATRSTVMGKLGTMEPGAPSPFDGNLIIFGVGPRASSTKPSPSTSAEPSQDDLASQAQGRMMEAVDAKMLADRHQSTEKPLTNPSPSASTEPGSASAMNEAEMAEQREMMRKMDESVANLRAKSLGTEKP